MNRAFHPLAQVMLALTVFAISSGSAHAEGVKISGLASDSKPLYRLSPDANGKSVSVLVRKTPSLRLQVPVGWSAEVSQEQGEWMTIVVSHPNAASLISYLEGTTLTLEPPSSAAAAKPPAATAPAQSAAAVSPPSNKAVNSPAVIQPELPLAAAAAPTAANAPAAKEVGDKCPFRGLLSEKFADKGADTASGLASIGCAIVERYIANNKDFVSGDAKDAVAKNFAAYSVDMEVPDSPAFTLIGGTPSTISRPSTPRELVTSIKGLRGDDGKVKPGLGIDFTPYLLFAGDQLSLYDYRNDPLRRILARTQISAATLKGSDKDTDKSVKIGVGAHVVLYDAGDVRLDDALLSCNAQEMKEALNNIPSVSDELQAALRKAKADAKDADDEYYRQQAVLSDPKYKLPNYVPAKVLNERLKAKCFGQTAMNRNWNRSSWTAGFGRAWLSSTGSLSDRKAGAQGIWTTYGFGFDTTLFGMDFKKAMPTLYERSQLIFHARRLRDEIVADPIDKTKQVARDSDALGVRFRYGKATQATSLEWNYERNQYDDRPKDKIRRVAIGFEFKMSDNLWLVLSAGGEGGRKNGESNNFALGSIKYGYASDRFLAPTQ